MQTVAEGTRHVPQRVEWSPY